MFEIKSKQRTGNILSQLQVNFNNKKKKSKKEKKNNEIIKSKIMYK